MPRRGRTNEEIVHALHQVEGGDKVTEVCRRRGISEQTFYRWRKQTRDARQRVRRDTARMARYAGRQEAVEFLRSLGASD